MKKIQTRKSISSEKDNNWMTKYKINHIIVKNKQNNNWITKQKKTLKIKKNHSIWGKIKIRVISNIKLWAKSLKKQSR